MCVVADGDWYEDDGKSKHLRDHETRWAELTRFLGPRKGITDAGLVEFFEHCRTKMGYKPSRLMGYVRSINCMVKKHQGPGTNIYKFPGVNDFIEQHIPKACTFFSALLT